MTRNLRPWRGTGIRPLDDLYKEMDGLVQHFFSDDPGRGNGTRDFVPALNLSETENEYELTIDLPGMKPEDVSVEVHENQLTVSGTRSFEQEASDKTFHRVERRFGEFLRTITLPAPVDEESISANFEQGVLKVALPKSEKLRPTRIPIKS